MEKAFASYAREYGLTYSQCPVDPQDMLDYFKSRFGEKMIYAAVVRETHLDGNFHLHCHIQFGKSFHATARTFDRTIREAVYHPNVQKVKFSRAWKEYISKDGVPLEWGEFQEIKKKTKRETLTNSQLLNDDIAELVYSEKLSLYSVPSLLNARKVFQEIQKRTNPDCVGELPLNWDGLTLPLHPITVKVRHYWLYSVQPNKGKSTFLQKLDAQYRCSWYSCAEKYQTVMADSQFLLFDEYGKGNGEKTTVLNQICDGTYKFPCKSRPAITLNHPTVIICSNFPVDEVYLDANARGRIMARFNEICLDPYDFIK